MTALMHRSRRLLVVLAVALGVTLAFTTALPASASNPDSSKRRNYYGAIAIDAHGAWGGSYDYGTKRKALRRANLECKEHSEDDSTCQAVVWVRNGCAAVAVRQNSSGLVTRYGWGIDRYKGPAINKAKHKCGRNCRKLAFVCTTRP